MVNDQCFHFIKGSFARYSVLAAFWRGYFFWGKSTFVKMERVFTCQNWGTSSQFLHLLLQQFNSALPEAEVHQVWLHSGRSCSVFGLRKIHMSPGELLCGRNRWNQTLRVYTGMSRDLKCRKYDNMDTLIWTTKLIACIIFCSNAFFVSVDVNVSVSTRVFTRLNGQIPSLPLPEVKINTSRLG